MRNSTCCALKELCQSKISLLIKKQGLDSMNVNYSFNILDFLLAAIAQFCLFSSLVSVLRQQHTWTPGYQRRSQECCPSCRTQNQNSQDGHTVVLLLLRLWKYSILFIIITWLLFVPYDWLNHPLCRSRSRHAAHTSVVLLESVWTSIPMCFPSCHRVLQEASTSFLITLKSKQPELTVTLPHTGFSFDRVDMRGWNCLSRIPQTGFNIYVQIYTAFSIYCFQPKMSLSS